MNSSNNRPREARSVRLGEDEWVLAEAIARLNGERGAGQGLRTALKREARRLRRGPDSSEFDLLVRQLTAERTAGDR